MNYKCQHRGCDICGTSEKSERLKQFGALSACDSCVQRAVKFAYDAACTWACGEIDLAKPCRHCRVKQAIAAPAPPETATADGTETRECYGSENCGGVQSCSDCPKRYGNMQRKVPSDAEQIAALKQAGYRQSQDGLLWWFPEHKSTAFTGTARAYAQLMASQQTGPETK